MPGPQQYTEDELIDMPEAERLAAIEAMDFTAAQAAADATTKENDDATKTVQADPAPAAAATAVVDPAGAAAADPATGAAPAVAAAPAQDPAAEPRPAPVQIAPVFVAKAPDNTQEQLDKIAADKAALRKKYDDGDIDFDAYETGKDALSEQATSIKQEAFKAELAADMEQQRQANTWLATCDAFVADKAYKTNPRLFALLDMEVRTLGSTDAGKAMTGIDILAQAHKNLIEAGFVQTAAAPAAAAAPAGITAKAPPAAPLPPNLALVPAADASGTGSKWDSMIRMMDTDPEAYEEAVMKLSESDRNALLRAQA